VPETQFAVENQFPSPGRFQKFWASEFEQQINDPSNAMDILSFKLENMGDPDQDGIMVIREK
jgi:hypothetical protein